MSFVKPFSANDTEELLTNIYRILIDRNDAEDRVISIGAGERAGGPELWKGPADLPKTALAAGMHVLFLAKEAKGQSYLRPLPS